MSGEESNREAPLTYDLFIVKNLDRMAVAKANRENWRYWSYFVFTFKLLSIYLSPDLRKRIEDNYEKMLKQIADVEKSTTLNENSKKPAIEKLRMDFADSHEIYMTKALVRTGVVKVKDEGSIDVNKIDLEKMTAIIRWGHGLETSARENGLLKSSEDYVDPEKLTRDRLMKEDGLKTIIEGDKPIEPIIAPTEESIPLPTEEPSLDEGTDAVSANPDPEEELNDLELGAEADGED